MSENKYCGSCKNFTNEDVNGYGWCSRFLTRTRCGSGICRGYEMPNNGWTELTPDNVGDIIKNQQNIVVMNPDEWDKPEMLYTIPIDTLELYAKWGGLFYYVLPELKIERNEQADTN